MQTRDGHAAAGPQRKNRVRRIPVTAGLDTAWTAAFAPGTERDPQQVQERTTPLFPGCYVPLNKQIIIRGRA